MTMKIPDKKLSCGFTLLEVLVAITLTAMVLGSFIALQSSSHKLQYKSMQKIQHNLALKAAFNRAWLGLEDDPDSPFRSGESRLVENEELDNIRMRHAYRIERITVLDADGGQQLSSTRLVKSP